VRALWVLIFSCSTLCAAQRDVQIGVEKYAAALRVQEPSKKSALLNEALEIFLSNEGDKPSGQLLYDIGNTYFHLGDIGLAIAYYRRSQVLLPRSPRVSRNLIVALQEAEVEGNQIYRPVADFLGVRWCSPFERGLVALGLILMTIIFFSFHLWLPGYGFRWIWRGTALLALLFITAITFYDLFMFPRAVVIKESSLKGSMESRGEPISLLSSGEMVHVISYSSDNQWVGIRTSVDVQGFLPASRVVIVDQ